MKAVLQSMKTGTVTVEEVPPAMVRPGTVLVRTVCSLISAGTEKSVLEFARAGYWQKARQRPDLFRKVLNRARNEGLWQTYQIVRNLIDQPLPLGYSSAGIITRVGAEIDDLCVGQRVACAGLFAATHSELAVVPRNLVVPVPEGVSFEEACFVTLGAIALQGVRLAGLELGDNVVIYGLGLVGMVAAQLALAAGCRVVGVDLDPCKVEMARGLGCHGVVADSGMPAAVLNFTGGYGADKVLLCAATRSNEPIETVPAITRQKGVLVVIGDVSMNVPRRAYYDKEIDIRISRSYGPGRYDPSYEGGGLDYPYAYVRWTENRNMAAVLDLAARRRLDFRRLITHRFPIDEAVRAYDLISGKTGEPYLGIVLRYCEDEPMPKVFPNSVNFSAVPRRTGEVSLGVIGAGNFAKAFLLPAFAAVPGVRFRRVCTASGVSAAAVARKYGAASATSDADEIFQDPDVDAVLIATRHDSHARYVSAGLRAGKAVYVEKPLATRLEDLEAIRALYEELQSAGQQPLLTVGYNRRFSPLARSLKEALARTTEPFAAIYRVNAGRVPASEWVHNPEIGGGRLIGECCHFVDFLSFLADGPPVSVWAAALSVNGRPVPDVITLTLEFGNGSLGTIHYFANGHPSLPKELIEVHAGGISAQLFNFRSLKLYGARVPGRKYYFNQVKGFAEEARVFIAALRGGEPPIPFEQLYQTCRATILAEESLRSGSRVQL
ncbi:MAG TPA: bi-domain-containing oxidoreductase [Gemmataceae bacterium]|nr:bi-domain-containing oxidoreductase [Gemmataceae bacterium]